jgi:hypothetical protein
MMKNKLLILTLGLLFITGLVFTACQENDQPVLGVDEPDPNPTGSAPPVVTTILPDTGFWAAEVTIQGSGFNPTPEFNLVTFGGKVVNIAEASETELKVITPLIIDETVDVKASVKGSEYWSEAKSYTFKPAEDALNMIVNDLNWPMGVEADDAGNIYVGSATDEAIIKIAPDGTQSVFANVPISGAIGWGPAGYLYCAQSWEGKVVRVTPDGTTVEDYIDVSAAIDFDWAENGNMYIIRNYGEGIDMYDGTTVTHVADFGDEMKSCRVFGDNLYVSAIWAGIILKYPITSDGLGEPETIIEGDSPVGLEMDENGTLYYSLAWEYTLFTREQSGSEDALFEGMLEDPAESPMRYMTYHNQTLYIVYPGWSDPESGSVLSIYLGFRQAPNHGLKF